MSFFRPVMKSATMKVWVRGEEVERLVDHFEEKIKIRYGGFPEIQSVPIPRLNPGERIEKRKYRLFITRT